MFKPMYIVLLVIVIVESSFIDSTSPLLLDENNISDQYGMIFTRSQRRFQQQMLQAHNHYRAHHCASLLQLDDTLSRSAQFYAEQLANTNGMSRSDTKGAGQNIFAKSSSAHLNYVDGKYICFYIV